MLGAGIAYVSGGLAPGAVLGAVAMEKIATSKQVAAPMARGLLKAATAFRKNPDRWEAATQALVAASAISSELLLVREVAPTVIST
jgi:hypothetical protein